MFKAGVALAGCCILSGSHARKISTRFAQSVSGKLQKKIVVLGEKPSNFLGDVLGMFEYRKDASKDSPCAELANRSCFPLV